MSIVRATANDLEALHGLFRSARYQFADFGPEDLPNLLGKSESYIGSSSGAIWGFLSLQCEERPSTLPPQAPSRSYLRALALEGGFAPADYVQPLLSEALRGLTQRRSNIQVITYGGEGWIFNSLHDAGFTVADQVQFYELNRPHHNLHALPPVNSAATLVPAESKHLPLLAELDAAAFPALWHFGHQDMLELYMRSRLQIALQDGRIAGYTAGIHNSSDELQLARLAVHPDFQRQGVGRQLLHDVVEYAAAELFERVILNTQTDNDRSQYLYRSYGFHPISKPVPILVLTLGEHEEEAPCDSS